MSAVGMRDDFAARIVHRLSCTRCVQGWSCGGLAEGDYAAAADIADLLAEVRAEERERVAVAIEADTFDCPWRGISPALVDACRRYAAGIARNPKAVRDA